MKLSDKGGERAGSREPARILGSATQAISDTAGTAPPPRYYPYGAQRGGGEVSTPYQYTGQKWEANDALEVYYYQARWYDPALRRFLQPDTIAPEAGNSQNMNRYSYCLGNPLHYIDPTGHQRNVTSNNGSSIGCTGIYGPNTALMDNPVVQTLTVQPRSHAETAISAASF